MVQLSTLWGDPYPGNGPPVRRFLSNYFDLLLRSHYQTSSGIYFGTQCTYLALFVCMCMFLMDSQTAGQIATKLGTLILLDPGSDLANQSQGQTAYA